ncbi:hypothetical protein EDB82DRAFT_474465 [Fusarium venenatum]|uniref:uncharacterized protein n=1 Tax=Fusarium venenatum TaxID=56646 RepID=UPI001DB691D8|nr:hypothetical protein EDB82DRAFT_474465 [Fusarium venenatum]
MAAEVKLPRGSPVANRLSTTYLSEEKDMRFMAYLPRREGRFSAVVCPSSKESGTLQQPRAKQSADTAPGDRSDQGDAGQTPAGVGTLKQSSSQERSRIPQLTGVGNSTFMNVCACVYARASKRLVWAWSCPTKEDKQTVCGLNLTQDVVSNSSQIGHGQLNHLYRETRKAGSGLGYGYCKEYLYVLCFFATGFATAQVPN